MDNLIIPICILITVLQVAHTYLRFLAFKKEMNQEDIQRLWYSVTGFAVLSCFIYYNILNDLVLSTITYKTLLILGWIPYFSSGDPPSYFPSYLCTGNVRNMELFPLYPQQLYPDYLFQWFALYTDYTAFHLNKHPAVCSAASYRATYFLPASATWGVLSG